LLCFLALEMEPARGHGSDSCAAGQDDDSIQQLAVAENASILSTLTSFQWVPTGPELLAASEARVLKALRTRFEQRMVKLPSGHDINTLVMGQGPPLVLIHGWGAGIGIFIANLDHLAQHFTVYSCDLLGFGRSSRPTFNGTTPEDGEAFFLDSMSSWFEALSLTRVVLVGHSMGAFLSASFAVKWPERVEKLILADPWGVPRRVFNPEWHDSWTYKILAGLVYAIKSPLIFLRAVGPLGPSLFYYLAPDLGIKFKHICPPDHIASYVYHSNVQDPSGDLAFNMFTIPGGWASTPLVDRLPKLPTSLPLYVLFGRDSWVDPRPMMELKTMLTAHKIEVLLLPRAGHHVYIDAAEYFNRAVCSAGLSGTMADVIADLAEFQTLRKEDEPAD